MVYNLIEAVPFFLKSMTTPKLSEIKYTATKYDEFTFRITGVDVSFVNAIRRTILSDIPTVVIVTKRHGVDIQIDKNTSKLHNEILKHRLGCIPVCVASAYMAKFVEKYELVIDKTNETCDVQYVTTEHFRIRDRNTGTILPVEEQQTYFPCDPYTKDFISFNRLLPRIGYDASAQDDDDDAADADGGGGGGGGGGVGGGGVGGGGGGGSSADESVKARIHESSSSVPCEKISLRANFGISTARENASFNVVSVCTYTNTINEDAVHVAWIKHCESNSFSSDELVFEKKNFMTLNALQITIPNSFDFRIQSLGMMHGRELIQTACELLLFKLQEQEENIKSNYPELIQESQTTIDNCFDIRLVNEDYTLGMMIEFIGYERFYLIGRGGEGRGGGGKGAGAGAGGEEENEDEDTPKKLLNFFAFQKAHPHNHHSVVRIGFYNPTTKEDVVKIFCDIVFIAKNVMRKIHILFQQ